MAASMSSTLVSPSWFLNSSKSSVKPRGVPPPPPSIPSLFLTLPGFRKLPLLGSSTLVMRSPLSRSKSLWDRFNITAAEAAAAAAASVREIGGSLPARLLLRWRFSCCDRWEGSWVRLGGWGGSILGRRRGRSIVDTRLTGLLLERTELLLFALACLEN